MKIWSATLSGDGRPHTFLGRVFDALEGRQADYDFLLTGVEAYPSDPGFRRVNHAPLWISGRELTDMVRREDFQWVWGALLAYAPEAAGEEALFRVMGLYTPESPDRDSWRVRDRFAETGAEVLIFAEDSTCTQLLTRDRALLEIFCRHEPRAAVRELAEG